MVKNGNECKNLEILWWLQLLKRQILTFLPRLSFRTVRSVVRIHSPRPTTSSTYGYLHRWPFLFCGRIVAEPIGCDSYSLHRSSLSSVQLRVYSAVLFADRSDPSVSPFVNWHCHCPFPRCSHGQGTINIPPGGGFYDLLLDDDA